MAAIINKYTACSLPPWLPKRFGDRVTEILDTDCKRQVNERLEVLREYRQFSQGSVSPIFHGELTQSKAIRCLSRGLRKAGRKSGSKMRKRY